MTHFLPLRLTKKFPFVAPDLYKFSVITKAYHHTHTSCISSILPHPQSIQFFSFRHNMYGVLPSVLRSPKIFPPCVLHIVMIVTLILLFYFHQNMCTNSEAPHYVISYKYSFLVLTRRVGK